MQVIDALLIFLCHTHDLMKTSACCETTRCVRRRAGLRKVGGLNLGVGELEIDLERRPLIVIKFWEHWNISLVLKKILQLSWAPSRHL
jgi:hypothetical protein